MNLKEYEMPDGKKAVFEYDHDGIGKVTIEAMDMLMGLIADGRKRGEWIRIYSRPNVYKYLGWTCNQCEYRTTEEYAPQYFKYCPNCGARMKGADDEH